MRHRAVERVCSLNLRDEIARTPMALRVSWQGEAACSRPGSLRNRAFARVGQPWTSIPLRELLRQAAVIDGGWATIPRPCASHRPPPAGRPTVYLLVRNVAPPRYAAATYIAFAGTSRRVAARGLAVMVWDDALAPPEPCRWRVVVTGASSPRRRCARAGDGPGRRPPCR